METSSKKKKVVYNKDQYVHFLDASNGVFQIDTIYNDETCRISMLHSAVSFNANLDELMPCKLTDLSKGKISKYGKKDRAMSLASTTQFVRSTTYLGDRCKIRTHREISINCDFIVTRRSILCINRTKASIKSMIKHGFTEIRTGVLFGKKYSLMWIQEVAQTKTLIDQIHFQVALINDVETCHHHREELRRIHQLKSESKE